MADLRIPSLGATPPTPRPTPRSEAARAAQRAFFDAARANAAAATPPVQPVNRTAPVQRSEAPARAQATTAPTDAQASDPVRRLPRPGSILDIKV